MRNMRRKLMAVAGVALLTAGLSVATGNPASASSYAPGTAIAYSPVYSADAGGYKWHCSFDHWRSGAKVIWTCELHGFSLDEGGDYFITSKKGSWTPPPARYNTATSVRKPNPDGGLCVVASAYSVDGGATTVEKCNG